MTRAKIVSLTVTEKGYCCDLTTGQLDLEHPSVAWLNDSKATDKLTRLQEGDAPQSALGYLIQALSVLKSQGKDPFTVMSCDNL